MIGAQGDQDSPLLLKEVTFGLRCPVSVVHAITKALAGRTSPVRYYQMYEVNGRFILHRSEVNLDELEESMPKTAESGLEIFGDPEEQEPSGN